MRSPFWFLKRYPASFIAAPCRGTRVLLGISHRLPTAGVIRRALPKSCLVGSSLFPFSGPEDVAARLIQRVLTLLASVEPEEVVANTPTTMQRGSAA